MTATERYKREVHEALEEAIQLVWNWGGPSGLRPTRHWLDDPHLVWALPMARGRVYDALELAAGRPRTVAGDTQLADMFRRLVELAMEAGVPVSSRASSLLRRVRRGA